MDSKQMSDIQSEIKAFCEKNLAKIMETSGVSNFDEWLIQWDTFHTCYLAAAEELLRQANDRWAIDQTREQIEAETIVVEVKDRETGRVFRRSLPIGYRETAHGLILSGETLEGKSSEIALLSDTAIKKVADVTGKGSDVPHHDH